MFHHIPKEEKPGVLAEVLRVLKPGGRLEFLDFAGGVHHSLAHEVHGRQAGAAASEGLLARMREAGLVGAVQTRSQRTVAGAIGFYEASAPA
jgi:ubiquinone/menaquinone biosynthesis C-methylase UbiE